MEYITPSPNVDWSECVIQSSNRSAFAGVPIETPSAGVFSSSPIASVEFIVEEVIVIEGLIVVRWRVGKLLPSFAVKLLELEVLNHRIKEGFKSVLKPL